MTTVRVARIERRIPPGPVPDRVPTHVLVLADDAGRRDLPIWLLGRDSHRFADDARPGPSPDELTGRLLRAAGARVTAVDLDELGPEVTAARIELATPAGPRHITARLLDGLAMAITSGAPIRVADAVMDRLAVPAGTGQGGPTPEQTERDLRIDLQPRYEPRNLTFTAGRAGLFLRVMKPRDVRGPFTAQAALADPANHVVTIENHADWTTHEVTAPIPDDTNTIALGVFLAGPGRIELRDTRLTRTGLAD